MIKMPKALLEAWLADLRSNPPQGAGRLRNGESYCCLGRLQIAAGDEDVEHGSDALPLPVPSEGWLKANDVDFNGDQNPSVCVSDVIIERYDLQIEDWSLAELNDEGVPFSMIADIIEANAEGV